MIKYIPCTKKCCSRYLPCNFSGFPKARTPKNSITIFNDLTNSKVKIEAKIIYLKIKDKDMKIQIKENIQEG